MNSPSHLGRVAPDRPSVRRSGLLVVLLASAVLAGCASFSPDAGFSSIESAAKDKLGKDVRWARSDADADAIDRRVQELLAKPLSVDDAVQVALLNNRGLQARFQDLGITEAEVVQAGRLPNPGFTFGRLRKGDEIELERGLHLNLARLLTLPMVSRLEARRFEQVKREVTMDVLSHAAEARKAYFQALAAEETVRYMRQVKQTAEASAELARRMEQVGNFSKLARAREQAFYADATLGLARADMALRASRERLARLLGVWGQQTRFQLPERLPDLPTEARDQPDIEAVAMAQRLDVQAAKLGAEQTAQNLGLTRTTRFINVLELGLVRNTSNEAPRQTGWEIGLELPLFDWGGARVARAEAIYMQALHRAAETAINARSEVREAYGNYRAAYDIARHQRDEIVPVKKRISEEQGLRYNGMIIGVFELLADARSQITSVNAYIESLRDFWLAQSDLDMALIGKAAVASPTGPAAAAVDGGGVCAGAGEQRCAGQRTGEGQHVGQQVGPGGRPAGGPPQRLPPGHRSALAQQVVGVVHRGFRETVWRARAGAAVVGKALAVALAVAVTACAGSAASGCWCVYRPTRTRWRGPGGASAPASRAISASSRGTIASSSACHCSATCARHSASEASDSPGA